MSITVGMPFFNAEAYLLDAVRSVISQTYEDWELILVDDGSTDRSLEIAHSIDDKRIRVISDGKNKRLPHRLNQITREARFDLIARMDADDLISPSRFEKQLKILATRPDIDLVTSGVCSISNQNEPVGIRCGTGFETITGRGLLLGLCPIVHAALLGRKSWFLRNPYNEALQQTEDYELWLRAFSKKDFKIHILNQALYYYREEGNITAEKILRAYSSHRELYKIYGMIGFSKYELPLMTARSYCKSIAVKLITAFGKETILLSRRNNPITDPGLRSHFQSEIQRVLRTKVKFGTAQTDFFQKDVKVRTL